MSKSISITRPSLDPELLSELFEKLPSEVFEQLTHNWGKQTEGLARNDKENRLLPELLPVMRVKKYGPASDHQLELLEQEPGVGHTSGDISSRHWKLIQKVPPANRAGVFGL